MRKFTTLIALLLCLVFLVTSFTACGPKKKKTATEAPANNKLLCLAAGSGARSRDQFVQPHGRHSFPFPFI